MLEFTLPPVDKTDERLSHVRTILEEMVKMETISI
jgi:hypothetical protein